jgi:hypothetical protein
VKRQAVSEGVGTYILIGVVLVGIALVVIIFLQSGGGGTITGEGDLLPTTTLAQNPIAWYFNPIAGSCNWEYRKQITINHTQVVPPGQTSFPVLISLSLDPDLSGHARPDGFDILFTSSDGMIRIPHEVESYSSGTLVAWVKVPSLSSSTDTVLYMYYGNLSSITPQQNPTAVWDTDYKGIWHMKETTGGSGAIKDSTSYGNNGTDLGGPTLGAAGKIGNAIDFDGLNDIIYVENSGSTSSLDYTSGPFTISAWIYPRNTNVHIAGKRDGNSDQYQFGLGSATSPQQLMTASDTAQQGKGSEGLTLGNWYYSVVVVDASNYPEFYLNGTHEGWVDLSGTRPYTFPHRAVNFSIGARWATFPTTGARYSGLIDEVRVSSVARPVQWIQTEYNNQYAPAVFYSVGAEEKYWKC